MDQVAHQNRGAVQALFAALLFGLTAPFAKLYLTGIPAIEASGLLYLSAGLFLGFLLVLRRLGGNDVRRESPLGRGDIPFLIGSIAFGGLIGPALLLFGLAQVSGTIASLLLNLEVVSTVLLALCFGESLGKRAFWGCLMIMVGSAVLAIDPGQLGGGSLVGALAIALACLSWGIDNNLTQRLSGRDPLAIVTLKGLGAGPIALLLAVLTGAGMPSGGTVAIALILGAAGYGLSLVLFVLALRNWGTARTGSLFATAPFVGGLASMLFLHEAPNGMILVAGLIMACGVVFMLLEEHSHEHTHDSISHDHAHTHDEHHLHSHSDEVGTEPHSHPHLHEVLRHTHSHQPDLHHRHRHEEVTAESTHS